MLISGGHISNRSMQDAYNIYANYVNIRLFMQSTKERRVCDPYSPVTVNSQSKFNPRDLS